MDHRGNNEFHHCNNSGNLYCYSNSQRMYQHSRKCHRVPASFFKCTGAGSKCCKQLRLVNIDGIGTPGASFLWSTGATTEAINVTAGNTYTVRQTVNNCTSPLTECHSCTKTDTGIVRQLNSISNEQRCINYTASSSTGGTTFAWGRAAVAGISNGANNGTGNISEILVNTTVSPVIVTYVYTLTADG